MSGHRPPPQKPHGAPKAPRHAPSKKGTARSSSRALVTLRLPAYRPRVTYQRAFQPIFRVARLAMAPDTAECLQMLVELSRFTGDQDATADLIGCSSNAMSSWMRGLGTPTSAARRGIWATWARFLHPELLESVWTWVSWGKFYRPPTQPDPLNWSDWSI